MKRMLKIFQVIGIVSLIAVITAVSCGKAGDGDNNNNNNNANNSGGNNNGGNSVTPAIIITNLLANVATIPPTANPIKVDGTTISMKISTFAFSGEGNSTNFDDVLTEVDGNLADASVLRNKVFDIVYNGVSGGLVLVAPGNIAKVEDFTTPAIATTVPADNAGNEGVFLVAGAAASGFVAQGLNVYGVFINSDATATYAFSRADADVALGNTQPKFYCRAVVPEITTTTPAATATLKGGEKAECFVSRDGDIGIRARWLANATRKEIEIAVGAVKTDGKKLSEIGLDGTDDAAKAAAFADGLTAAEMKKIAEANTTDYKKFKIAIVATDAF